MQRFYSLGFTLAFFIALPYFLFQVLCHRKYSSSFIERLGILPNQIRLRSPGGIWIHAVSAGEVLSALPLIKKIRQRWPTRPVFLSTTSSSGHLLARQNGTDLDDIFYFPLDWKFSVRQTLKQVRPSLVLILETEIWANFLHECHRQKVAVCLANGRISDRSFQRYWKFRWLFRWALVHFDFCFVQDDLDRRRLILLGAPPNKVKVSGNLKYDIALPNQLTEKIDHFQSLINPGSNSFLVVAGSTRKNEEIFILEAFRSLQKQCPTVKLLLAPRHPNRCEEIEQLLKKLSFHYRKRSSLSPMHSTDLEIPVEVILLDTLGELPVLYALADLVFVGGSLVPWGGHNLLEPAIFKKPVLFGPYMNNFRDMSRHFIEAKAGLMVRNQVELQEQLINLYHNPTHRKKLGENGYNIIQTHQGSSNKLLDYIENTFFIRHTNHSKLV